MNFFERGYIVLKTLFYKSLNSDKAPIFIVCTGRCGSDLLVDVLSTNDEIKINKDEFYHLFLPALKYGRFDDPFHTDIINYYITLKKSLAYWNRIYRFKIKIILEKEMLESKKIYIVKSPAISFLLKEIHSIFPNAKFIHLYRNGYSVANSWCNKEFNRVKEYREFYSYNQFLKNCALYYNDSIKSITAFLSSIDQAKKHELSYEEFCDNPKEELGKLSRFLGANQSFDYKVSRIKKSNSKIDSLNPQLKDELFEIMEESMSKLGYKK